MLADPQRQPPDASFLPDFCEVRIVFSVVLIGQLLAFLLVLTPVSAAGNRWNELGLVSLFVQWVALTSIGLLCVCRRWLSLLSNALAGFISYALVLIVTMALSEAVYWLVEQRLLDLSLQSVFRGRGDVHGLAEQLLMGMERTPRRLEFLLRNHAISAIVAALALRYFYVQFQWRTNLESEALARIQALQSRIRPHFLFNCMNTIASLTRSNPSLAEQVVEDLADLFRASLGDARIPVRLERELEVCREYLRIEELRLGERLRTAWAVDSLPDDALLPALSLQPLLENAVYHGIEPAPEGGVIRVSGERRDDVIAVTIGNTLSAHQSSSRRPGNQMAQDNVAERLRAFFGPRGTIAVDSGAEEYRVRVEFPYRSEVE